MLTQDDRESKGMDGTARESVRSLVHGARRGARARRPARLVQEWSTLSGAALGSANFVAKAPHFDDKLTVHVIMSALVGSRT